MLGAWLYTLLSGRGAALVIGLTLIATVPLRRILRRRGQSLGEKGYAAGALLWGLVVGGTSGSGVMLLSLLMAAGLEGAAVIATDSARLGRHWRRQDRGVRLRRRDYVCGACVIALY